MRQIFLSLVAVFGLAACEGRFVGDREFDVEVINAPYTMKVVEVGAASNPYLVVLNTNYVAFKKTGSLQFYDFSNPESPTLISDLTISLPNNCLDFHIEPFANGEQLLFVANRNQNEVWVYEWNGNRFVEREAANGAHLQVEVFSNPVSFTAFTTSNGLRVLAIATQLTSTMQFLNIETLEVFDVEFLESLYTGINRADYRFDRAENVGALLEMDSRNDKPIRGISGSERDGRGIGRLAYLGGVDEIILGLSYTDEALFGFHFDQFDNKSNVLWNLDNAKNGERGRPGTKEEGFRGMAVDRSGNIWLSSRTDNGVYRVKSSVMAQERDSDGSNTLALDEDATDTTGVRRLNIDFDPDPTDDDFPRLGDIVVDNQIYNLIPDDNSGNTDSATLAWVVGLESDDRGFETSRIYMLDLDNPQILDTVNFDDGALPQRLLYYPSANLLYSANVGSNSISIFDVSSGNSMELLATQPLVNP